MTPPKTDAELQDAYRELVKNVVGRLDPYGVPLTPEEQAAFIRSVLVQAKAIHDSEPYLRAQMQKALDEFITQRTDPAP